VLDFTITVGNKGSVVARDVVVIDTIPSYLDIIGVTTTRGETSIEGQTVTVTIGSLAPGELVTIHIKTRINALALPGVGYNTATVVSRGDSDPTNNTSTVTFIIIVDSPPPAPTPVVVPPELPKTGAPNEGTGSLPLLVILGVLMIAAGLTIRRRGDR
jgi:uncharacterized repeat protein (TIGR01451 family)